MIRRAARSAPDQAVFAGSSSAIRPGLVAADLPEGLGERILVGHPGNPPYLIPVIELVPSPSTATWAVERARAVYTGAGLRPITVCHEPEGFVFNRLQGAVLREAYCLLRDGIATVDEIDEVVRGGLGRRWSVIGPFETVDLNTRGGLASAVRRPDSPPRRRPARRLAAATGGVRPTDRRTTSRDGPGRDGSTASAAGR
ncbi:3-hydroxyacyl-CoA dehydrogenase family protein [Streptomyces sp. NPDC086519]|uniref:3-hydroxyacyl-CoA dehydrogenase family protein n=1 Tax=Streptomyces sp. NPDC086519 TaxID=3154863 RepID=UPI003424B330